jgi:hypothetical protein
MTAVAAYALPTTLGLVTDLGHGAHHLVETVREHRRMAEALGLVHLHEDREARASDSRVSSSTDAPPAPGHLVHSHGGAAHSHDAATDALLLAAQEADEGSDEAQAPTVKLAGHVPAGAGVAPTTPRVTVAGPLPVSRAAAAPDLSPVSPPPRA